MIKNPSKQTCAYCGISFQFPSGLKQHLIVHDGEEEEEDCGIVTTSISVSPARTTKQDRTCQICGQVFQFPSQMKRHMLNHTGEMTFQCLKCKVAFSSRKNLKMHCVKKHGKSAPPDKAPRRVEKAAKDTLCSICGKLLRSPSMLERHLRIHTGEKPFECDRCGRSFSSRENLQRHIRVHTVEKPFKYDRCGRSFSLNENLQRHMRVHTRVKLFECDVCPEKFSLKGALKKHCVRVHKNAVGKESSRMHICPQCGTCFKYLYLLNWHMTVHSQSSEKQFESEVFHKYFTRKGNLKTHLKKIHTDPAPETFECDVCNRTFSRIASLNAHRKKKHKDLAASGVSPTSDRTCPHCGELFAYPSAMKQHMRVHTGEKPFGCDVCNKSFSRKASLNAHQKKVHKDLAASGVSPATDRTCPHCGEFFRYPFDMKQHMRVHTGERPFGCDVCNKSFSRKDKLKAHQNNMHTDLAADQDRTCLICGMVFDSPSRMKRHMIQHTGEKPYQCSICVEYFSQAAALEEHHQEMHMKGKERIPAKDRTCKFCDAIFSTIAELVCHSQKECA